MSQKELALTVGVAQATVSEWESQKKNPSGERLAKLSEIFRVPSSQIISVQGHISPQEDTDAFYLRERLRRDPNYRLLFDAAEKAKPEHIRAAAAMLKSLEGVSDD
jgi:transcriptional regulator with XRE-family HTH domain